jgi:hypothetical protein
MECRYIPCFVKHGVVVNGLKARRCCAILGLMPFVVLMNKLVRKLGYIKAQLICSIEEKTKDL